MDDDLLDLLFVSSDQRLRRHALAAFRRGGHRCDIVRDAAEAWAALRRRRYDLVVADGEALGGALPDMVGLPPAIILRRSGVRGIRDTALRGVAALLTGSNDDGAPEGPSAVDADSSHRPAGDPAPDLSAREREVLAHLGQGLPVDAIARRLFISRHTVRNHLKAIYRKLGVGSQVEAARWYRRRIAPAPAPPGCADDPLAPLTPREREIVRRILGGLRGAEVAARLGISAHTVRNHLKAAYRKLGVHSRVELLGLLAADQDDVDEPNPPSSR